MLPVTHACKVSLISEHSLHDQGLWLVCHHPSTEEEEDGEGKHVDCEAGRELLTYHEYEANIYSNLGSAMAGSWGVKLMKLRK